MKKLFLIFVFYQTAYAKKTNQVVYEEPFDLAGGGASLTRATQEGMILSNPAQMPFGGKLFRWIGFKFNLSTAKESVDFAKSLAQGKSDSGNSSPSDMIDKISGKPIRVGFSFAQSFITSYLGFMTFGKLEPDLSSQKFGSAGLFEIMFQAEAYAGAAAAFAMRLGPYFSLGLTGKYLYAAEPEISIDISKIADASSLMSRDGLMEKVIPSPGMGMDAGFLYFLQGRTIDYRLALKVDDVGNTKFKGAQASFKQVMSVGTALTFHTYGDAIHLALDYRDFQNAYGEKWFKKTYAGMKVMTRSYVGVAAGLYQGYPTMGAVVDLLLLRIGASIYGRELGDSPGVNGRNMYVVSMAMGF